MCCAATKEAGEQTRPVSDYLTDPNHFYVVYHFKTKDKTTQHGHPTSAEVTGAYNGSNDNYDSVDVTIGIDGNGRVITMPW